MKLASSTTETKTSPTILNGPQTFQKWNSELKQKSKSQSGLVGYHLYRLTNPTMTNQNPGDPPAETDERRNPKTNKIIAGSLVYPRMDLDLDNYTANTADDIFDSPLTLAAQVKFDNDTKMHRANKKDYEMEARTLRDLDDSLFASMISTIDEATQAVIEMHPDYIALENRPSTYSSRSKDYLRMVTEQLSTGNMRLTSQNLLNIMNSPQGEKAFAAFLSHFESEWSSLTGLEDPEHPGSIKIDHLKFMLLLHNLNRNTPANKQALNNFFSTNPSELSTAMLITALLTQNIGELAEVTSDAASEQGSALIVSPSGKKKFVAGAKNASRSDHCKYCLKTSGDKFLYFYHPITECNRKKKDEAKATAAATAMVATAPTTAQESQQDLRDILMQVVLQQQQHSDSISALGNPSLP